MAAIISGNSLGLSLTSLSTLGQRGALGQAAQGRNGEQVYVNVANGNLVLQDRDDRLVGHGLEVAAVRTYNSQGQFNDDNADNWAIGIYRQQIKLTGTQGTAGSTLTRTDKDGAQAIYSWNVAQAAYLSTDGSGAYDAIKTVSGQYLWTDGATGLVEAYETASTGRLLSVTDTRGNAVSYAYNASGNLASMTDASGETSYFDYSDNKLTQVRTVTQNAAGVSQTLTRVRYSYDSSNRLSQVTVDLSPEDNAITDNKTYKTTYTYDGASTRVASITQSDGTALTFTYIQVGTDFKVATVRDGLNQLISYSYDTANRRTTVTDPLGLVTRYSYDAAGQLIQITAPAVNGVSQTSSFSYNSNGDLLQVIDGEGKTVDMAYDAKGNQIVQRDAAGNTITRSFDARNQLLTESLYLIPDLDGAGRAQASVPLTTRYVYDATAKNLLRFVISPEGRVTEYRYNNFGERINGVQYQGGIYSVGTLALTDVPTEAQMVTWVNAQNKALTQLSAMAYDFRGQLQTLTTYASVDATGSGIANTAATTQYVYDQAGQLLKTISATGGITQYSYDGLGRNLSASNALSQTTLTSYDDANNKTTVTLVNGLVATSAYDKNGRLISVIQSSATTANLGTTQYFYDADNRPTMTQDPTGVRNWMLYDEAGRKTADIDGNGSLTEYLYNKNNQLTQSIAYATAVNTAALVNAQGQPSTPTLASIRPAANAADRKNWRTYDAANRLSKTIDEQGAVTQIQYDGASRVLGITRFSTPIAIASLGAAPTDVSIAPIANASTDRISRNFYDNDGLLRATLDAEGALTELRYNSAGQLSSRLAYATATDPTLRASGTLAQLIPASSAADVVTSLLLNNRGQVAAEIDAEGYLTEKVYDGTGNPTQSVRYATPVSAATRATITSATVVSAVRPVANAEDRSTAWVYDALSRVIQEANAEGTVTQYSYDNAGNLTQTVRAAGTTEVRTLNARYDIQGRLTGELTAQGALQLTGGQTQAQIDTIWSQYGLTHSYDAAGRRTSTVDQNGNKTLFFYDVDGHLTHSVNALGEVQENQYNALGQLTATVQYGTRIGITGLIGANAGGLINTALTTAVNGIKNAAQDSIVNFTYNTTGTLATRVDALGNSNTFAYNAFGEEISRTQAISAGRTLTQTSSVDRRGLTVSTMVDAAGVNAITSATYDAFGRLIRSVDANGNVRQQSYDRLGRAISTIDPLNATRSSSYDAFGRVLKQTDALGNISRYVYNKANRSVTVTTPENIAITTVTTRLGQTQSVRDGNGNTTSYAYDKNGNLLSTTTALTNASQQYDRANRLIQTTDANGNQVVLSYDAANRILTRMIDPTGLNLITSYQYDAKGQQISVTDANGNLTQLVYDLKGQLLRQVIDPAGLNLITQYTYDARGKTLTLTNPAGVITQYSYDNLGRRTKEQIDPTGLNLTRGYAYDKNGNVTSTTDANGNVTRYAYDANDRLVFTLDALGNLQQNTYDAQGRITKATTYAKAINTTGLSAAPTVAQIQALIVATATQDLTENRVYDKDNRLVATVNGLGEVVKFTYDANGNVIERMAYANRIALSNWTVGTIPNPTPDAAHDQRLRTVFDQLNRALYTIDGAGAVIQQSFDGNGNVIDRIAYSKPIAASTVATTTAIASALTVVRDTTKDARIRRIYDKANRLAWSTDGVGAVTQQLYDKVGNLVKKIQYATAISATALPGSVVASSVDRITAITYDAANRQTFAVDALGGVTQSVYDKAGNLTQSVAYAKPIAPPTVSSNATTASLTAALLLDAANDRTTRFSYDAANRQVFTVDATGAVRETVWDGAGNALQTKRYATVIGVTGLSSSAVPNDIRARITTNSANDRIEQRAFDAANRMVYSVDPLGYVKKISYDGIGRISATTQYSLAIAASTANTLTAITAAIVSAPSTDRTNSFTYDAQGRLTASADALGYTETTNYNALGQKNHVHQ